MRGSARSIARRSAYCRVGGRARAGQDYPSKPIRILVPAQAGGIGDILPRILGAEARRGRHCHDRGREPHRRRRRDRRRSGRQGAARRLHAADGQQRPARDPPHLAKLPYDPMKDFAPVILMVTVPNMLVVHPSVPAKTLRRADRLRQGQSRQAQLRLAGHRRVRPHRGRAVQARGRRRHRARALQGRGAGGAGPRRRPRQHDVRRGVARARADQGRQGARARRRAKQRVAVLPEVPTWPSRAIRLRGRRLVRAAGAGRHAAGRSSTGSTARAARRSRRPTRAIASSRRAR